MNEDETSVKQIMDHFHYNVKNYDNNTVSKTCFRDNDITIAQSILVEETFKECNVCSKAIKDDEYICESCNLAFHENFMGKDSSCLGIEVTKKL